MGIFISMTRQIIFLIPLVLLLPLAFGIEGVMFAGPISDGVAGVLAIILVLRQFKKMPAEDRQIKRLLYNKMGIHRKMKPVGTHFL